MITTANPELDDLLHMLGEAGKRLDDLEASEAASGNISICLRRPLDLDSRFPVTRQIDLPQPVPELEGATFIVSGSGQRLRQILAEPTASLGCLLVDPGGLTAKYHTSHHCGFEHLTSEFNSHLAVHYDHICSSNLSFHTIIHAQPIHLTFLSHIPRYQEPSYLNTHLLRWQPETIINLPEGIGFITFEVPGSAGLMTANVAALHRHSIVIWAKHGVMARSPTSVMHAVDLLEYAERAARYEYLNLTVGEIGAGLSRDEICFICAAFNIQQDIF